MHTFSMSYKKGWKKQLRWWQMFSENNLKQDRPRKKLSRQEAGTFIEVQYEGVFVKSSRPDLTSSETIFKNPPIR
jgi:hypothetical protein